MHTHPESEAPPPGSLVKLSVVCAVFNASHCLGDMLDSYQQQRDPRAELIIVDGGSNDGTLDIVRSHPAVTRWQSERDRGIYDAWNKSLPLCQGSHVCFIGADDLIAPGALAILIGACESDGGQHHVIAGYNIHTHKRVPKALLGQPWVASRLPYRMMIAHVMSAHSLPWLRAQQGFDASFRSAGDYELLLRTRHGIRVRTLSAILAFMEEGGISRQQWAPHRETFRARRQNGLGLTFSIGMLIKNAIGATWRSLRRSA